MENNSVDKLINEGKLYYCVECGKCVAGCPMNVIYKDFSYEFCSRGIIRKAVFEEDILGSTEIWRCLNCNLCAEMCPTGVKYSDFILQVRNKAINAGYTDNCKYCEKCGQYYLPVPTIDAYKGRLVEKDRPDQYANLCPKCKLVACAEGMKVGGFRIGIHKNGKDKK
ncbi:MAG: 4Fe-4S dicluster domain-containing protein [Chloroflexi bacterium]|nr:4Fe-4S dicluster domain-containing protein [Chloroflexota bacterium]